MLSFYLLTGEAEEVPEDWISKVTTATISGEEIVWAMASQVADPEEIIRQFRAEYQKNFGIYRPKITKTATSTAYYLQLKKAKKPWRFIVEEYIRFEEFKMPRDRSSKKYQDTWRMYVERLKKRIQRTETIFDALIRDKK